MIQLPLAANPASRVTVDTGNGVFIFATYWMQVNKTWLMDILDSNANLLLSGIALLPGIDNLLKGQGELFKNIVMQVQCTNGTSNATADSLGNTAQVLWFTSSEINPIVYKDPLA